MRLGLPNGSIYTVTGLLASLQSDAQLAGILAREIAHVTNRDSYHQFRAYRNKTVGRNFAEASVVAGWGLPAPRVWDLWRPGLPGPWLGTLIEAAGGVGWVAMTTSLFGYSSEREREADVFSASQMAAVGYDPMELARAFRLLNLATEAELIPTFYNDSRKLEERIKYVISAANGLPRPSDASPAPGSQYSATVENAVRYNIQADIDSRRFRTAVTRAGQLVNAHPEDPEDAFLLAEAYRALGPRTAEPSDRDMTRRGSSHAKKELKRRTAEEEDKELLSRPKGPAIRRVNQERAEQWYRKAQVLDASYPDVYRGLGLLYEDQGKSPEAQAAYRKYLELAPEGPQSLRIQRRLDGLDKARR